jgi:hypothetical protein
VTLSIENGISTVHSIDSSAVQLGDGQIKDVKISDDSILLALWESKGKSFHFLTTVSGMSNQSQVQRVF